MNWGDRASSTFDEVVPFFLLSDFATDSLKTGDIVLRNGTGVYSRVNRFIFSKENQFSHCGIISIENDTVFVYHALGGRESVTNQLRKDELAHYCNKRATTDVAFYRYNLNGSERNELSNVIKQLYVNRTYFDGLFNLESCDDLYHTELVYHVLTTVTDDIDIIPQSNFFGKKYISLDKLYKNENAKLLASFDFR
ncbi:MAG: hypothetical protein HKO56_02365 [Bacteroidia bacterium]|nr:hypothetical protein [Bacteroidia bacterium]NNM15475.1 hypothetical protein [Bacteroidia bacterium]